MTKPDGVSDADWEAAVKGAASELLSAYEEADEMAPTSVYEAAEREPPEEARAMDSWELLSQIDTAIFESEEHGYAYLMDVYFDDNSIYAIANSEGRLYKIPFVISGNDVTLGAWQAVEHEFAPVEQRSAFTVKRQADGRYRWFSQSCTAVLNRSGEIDSTELFDNFIRRLAEYGYPYRTFYHQGEAFRTGQADFVARDGYVLITSGLYDDTELAQLEVRARENDPDYWGESISYFPLQREVIRIADVNIPVYTDGYMSEISTLPEQDAAALFTKTNQKQEVSRMLQGKALDAFMKLAADAGMDATAAQAWLEQNVDETNRQISDTGLIARAQDDEAARLNTLIERQQETINELLAQVEGFVAETQARLGALEATETQRRQDYINDMPAQPVVNIWRPKVARDSGDTEEVETSAADKAKAVLAQKRGKKTA